MIRNKGKEILVSNYIIQNTNLLFQKTISNIEIKEKGKLVELWLYYLPSSKFETWKLKKEFIKEPQYIACNVKNGMLCAKFLAPSKFADLIICKLHSVELNVYENKILNYCETKTRAARDE